MAPGVRHRRARGTGSIYKRGDGLWVGAVNLPMARGVRRRKCVSALTFCAALRKLSDLAPYEPAKQPRTRQANMALARSLGDHTLSEWYSYLHTRPKCYYCGRELHPMSVIKEHKTPVSRGGSNSMDNIVASCVPCNSEKGACTEAEYAEWKRLVGRG